MTQRETISNNRGRTIASATMVFLLVFTSVLAQRNKSAQGKTGFNSSARAAKPQNLPLNIKTKTSSATLISVTNNFVSVSASANAASTVTSTVASTSSLGQVSLAWTPVTNATGYRIWRSSPNNSGFTAVGRSAATSFVCTGLTNGLLYSFVITSTNATQESLPSAVVTARAVTTSSPQLSLVVTNGAIQLSWPADHIGWELLAQSAQQFGQANGVWYVVSNSISTNQIIIPIVKSNPGVFFKLALP